MQNFQQSAAGSRAESQGRQSMIGMGIRRSGIVGRLQQRSTSQAISIQKEAEAFKTKQSETEAQLAYVQALLAKKPKAVAKKSKTDATGLEFMVQPTNSLDEHLKMEREKEAQRRMQEEARELKVQQKSKQVAILDYSLDTIPNNLSGGEVSLGLNEIVTQMEKKLDSAQRRFNPQFNKQNTAKVNQFEAQLEPEKTLKRSATVGSTRRSTRDQPKTPSTMERTGANKSSTNMGDDGDAYTPEMFKASASAATGQTTDEQGNRLSLLPGSSRPSKKRISSIEPSSKAIASFEDKPQQPKASMLDILKTENATRKPVAEGTNQRKNFVRMNTKVNYKPRIRGAAFTNKVMAKKVNSQKAKARWAQKKKIEELKNRDQVNMYGGLGKVGLDYVGKKGQENLLDPNEEGDNVKDENEYQIPAFSGSAVQLINAAQRESEENKEDGGDDEELLYEGFDQMMDELKQIDEEVEDVEVDINDLDKASYAVPESDEGYKKILKERFGHDEFLEGQLDAIKILVQKRKNALVVLATGGGKSLIYQYTTQFMPGLILVVTPLIALMTDQLGKLPDYMPGACINSQQSFPVKQAVLAAVKDKKIKVLFITPERFFTEDLTKYGRKISMVCVDEIHCASEWSHNFRPTYLMLHEMIREKLGPSCRVLGLTATATKSTQKQICSLFDIQYPNHLITQPDLSRLNLQLSITRDNNKTKALMTLLKSDSFKGLTSILLFATQRRTADQIAGFLNQNGISAASYHAGKSDEQRNFIQKQFIQNKTRVLCCTIAFSMGIDKSDIQSVIHYDMPRAIENYVQEIGRAGRDGTLARCHMFLDDADFYQLRQITLQDLLDSQSGYRLTNRVICQAKNDLLAILKPELVTKKNTKKRKRADFDAEEEDLEFAKATIIEEFSKEGDLAEFYSGEGQEKTIKLDEIPDLENKPMYICLDTKEMVNMLDLKKEVILTMLNQLEQVEGRFFKVESILPASVHLRFHNSTLEELAENDRFFKVFQELSPKPHQGVYRCSLPNLAVALGVKPYNVPRILYSIQHNGTGNMTYDTEHESFVLQILSVPAPAQSMPLANAMLTATHKIESALMQKLNCMYFVARLVSLPSIEVMLKKEKASEDGKEMYLAFSRHLNKLINIYFSITKEEDMEVQIAGSEEERNLMMPTCYVDTHRDKAELESEIRSILKDYHKGMAASQWMDPNNRMKPLDVTKVLMGIRSKRENVMRFQNDRTVWERRKEYDYNDILKVCQAFVPHFYMENLPTSAAGGITSKKAVLR